MWSQLKGALRNVILVPPLIMTCLVIYSVFLLRGRGDTCSGPDDLLLRSIMRYNLSTESVFDYNQPSKHLTYTLNDLDGGRYERKVTNRSWRPFLVTMYEFENWRYTLPDKMLLRYASRYLIRNTRTDLEIDGGTGFDCGSGLGMTLIRPWESFTDTVEFEELMPRMTLRDQLAFADDNFAFDRLTDTHIGDPLGERGQYYKASLMTMVPDDKLEIRLYLPVTDYLNGEPARVYADGFTVGRWDMLEREVGLRTRKPVSDIRYQ